ncbi:hypothetical protein RJ639_000074 [Escallonia herrerae]|uniref:Uncharacterized protein n=1 Tax=Escallonia herrerae TaxID=1293975 RepID=A0AA88XJC3_9ASTE|nr:hypothetical protein RJ639_000074 [Escallonia herrerae]
MFNPRTELANTHLYTPYSLERVNDGYDRWGAADYGAKARKTAQNYENYRTGNSGGVQFRPNSIQDDSGVCSPPLWRTSPPLSPGHPHPQQNNFRHLSPASRSQAIARGQWELMEMVKNMPESSYELSLKDLVEKRRVDIQEERIVEERNFGSGNAYQRVNAKRQESIIRSGSFDNSNSKGLFLKMAFPFSLGSNKKKKNSAATNPWAKVSPKPEVMDKSPKGGAEKEWWRKRFSASGESESGVTSSNSGSTGSSGSSGSSSSSRSNSGRTNSACSPSFCTFFESKKSKFAKR